MPNKNYGYEHLVRPNRNRRKTTVYLAPEDWERIQAIKNRIGMKTAAAAIRAALESATEPPPPQPDTTAIGTDILNWATNLQYKSSREERELHELSRRLYEMVTRPAAV